MEKKSNYQIRYEKNIIYLLLFIASQSCVAQEDKTMKTNDRFDYEYYKKKIGKDKIDSPPLKA